MPWLYLQATQPDGLCLGLPVMQPEHQSQDNAKLQSKYKFLKTFCKIDFQIRVHLGGFSRIQDRAAFISLELCTFLSLSILSTNSVDLNQNYLLSEFSTLPLVRVILEKLLIGLVVAKKSHFYEYKTNNKNNILPKILPVLKIETGFPEYFITSAQRDRRFHEFVDLINIEVLFVFMKF